MDNRSCALIAAKAALDYFTFLVKENEIDDPKILNYYRKANLSNLNSIDKRYEFIECEMKHDTNLATALRDIFPSDPSSEAPDPFSVLAKIRRELSEDKEVWEHTPTRRIRDKVLFWKKVKMLHSVA